VAEDDDSGPGLCSQITYDYTEAACGLLELHLGCFGSGTCQMTATVEVTGPHFFPFTTVLSDTSFALQNFDKVQQSACPGETLFFSTCSLYFGDTFIRLFLDGLEVAVNDNTGVGIPCSEITYDYTEAACGLLE
ncbi:hypothetical protein B484DRAFT_412379, partial [Ochromonadaceae sp. CCMP2298]